MVSSYDTYILYFCCFIGGSIITVVALALVRGNGEMVEKVEEKVEESTITEAAPVKKKAGRPRKIKADS